MQAEHQCWKSFLPEDRSRIQAALGRIDERGGPRPRESRRSERIPLNVGVTIASLRSGAGDEGFELYEVAPYDLSESGVGLVHRVPVEPGMTCRIGLRTATEGVWTMVGGVIIRCEDIGDGLFDLGVSFDTMIRIEPFLNRNVA